MLLIVPIITTLLIGIILLSIIFRIYTGSDIRQPHRETATRFMKILQNKNQMRTRIRKFKD